MNPALKRRIVVAFAKAVAVCLFLWFGLVAGLLAYWRLDSPLPYSKTLQEQKPVEEQIRDLADLIKLQQQAVHETVGQQRERALRITKDQQRRFIQRMGWLQNGDDQVDLTHTQQLLETWRLQDLPNPQGLFTRAMEELQTVVDKKDSVVWADVNQALRPSSVAPSDVERRGTQAYCPASSEYSDLWATTEQLEEWQRAVEERIQRRANAASVSSVLERDNILRVQNQLTKDMNALFDSLSSPDSDGASGDSPRKSSDKCLTEDQYVVLIERGLDALYEEKDLRAALQKAAQELDPSAPPIILDADLPVEPNRRVDVPDSINLRQIIDSQLLHQSAGWIDQLVDILGGYNDGLDSFLDSIAPGDARVGQVAVSKVLELASRVKLPHPSKLASKQTR